MKGCSRAGHCYCFCRECTGGHPEHCWEHATQCHYTCTRENMQQGGHLPL